MYSRIIESSVKTIEVYSIKELTQQIVEYLGDIERGYVVDDDVAISVLYNDGRVWCCCGADNDGKFSTRGIKAIIWEDGYSDMVAGAEWVYAYNVDNIHDAYLVDFLPYVDFEQDALFNLDFVTDKDLLDTTCIAVADETASTSAVAFFLVENAGITIANMIYKFCTDFTTKTGITPDEKWAMRNIKLFAEKGLIKFYTESEEY